MLFSNVLNLRLPRRIALRTAVIVASFMGVFAVAPMQPVHATVSIPILQFNMCGHACGTGLTVANDLISSINNRNPQPDVVTLEEVCRSQYNQLYYNLAPYYGEFVTTVTGACGSGDDYGIAILVKTSSFTDLGATTLPNPGGNETRKMECVKTSAFGGSQPLVACVTHIDTHSTNQPSQIQSVANRASGYYSGNHVVVGGDFNVTPGSSYISPMYASWYSPAGSGIFNEADAPSSYSRSGGCAGCSTNEYTVCGGQHYPCGYGQSYTPTSKIDYIFLGGGDFASYSADATYALHSDHAPLWASTSMY